MKKFAVVAAVHNVARYLPEFIDSIESQEFDLSDVQIVAVDDGSTDSSLEVLNRWSEARPELVTVLTQDNAGQGSARNAGIGSVDAEWVTYIDPDDVIDGDYLSRVAAFIDSHPDVAMVATNRILWQEATGDFKNHPLASMFRGGDQLIDLDLFPDYFHGSSPAAFFRVDVIRRNQLRYDERVQPNFEDGHFCVSYLFLTGPMVGFVASAKYRYRKRADQSSTLQNSLRDPRKFTSVPRYGYLDVLERAKELYGQVPEWLQTFIIYELSFYFTNELAQSGSRSAANGRVASEFIDLARKIRRLIDAHVIESFAIRRIPSVVRDYLIHGLSDAKWCADYVVLDKYDPNRKLVRATYRYIGSPPEEVFYFKGRPARPIAEKRRSVLFFGQVAISERIAWLRANGTFEIRVNGVPMRLETSWPQHAITRLRPSALKNRVARRAPRRLTWLKDFHTRWQRLREAVEPSPQREQDQRKPLWITEDPFAALRFRKAWALMDRVHDADDSGERLFRYLRDARPDINAWFVLERGVPDWHRLTQDGYGSRLIAYGGFTWKQLMVNAEHLISSHIDVPVQNPPDLAGLPRNWRFTFLQHGVIKDDLSNWLNSKSVDLFITSTPDEYASIVGDGTPYSFTSHEVKLTGLPRFDRQREVGNSVAKKDRNLVLVAPTWRHWLTPPLLRGSQRRSVYSDFLETNYAAHWMGFLWSAELARFCRSEGLRIGFLPHPNIQSVLPDLDLPGHVLPLTFHGQDVQRTFARSAAMVTDYSSMAFNVAYIDRPVVYFQFDQREMLEGGHVGRAGYFNYERDGFGPVATTVESAVDAVMGCLAGGRRGPSPEYQRRIDDTFPLRDGRCCERVTSAIERLSSPASDSAVAVAKNTREVRESVGSYS